MHIKHLFVKLECLRVSRFGIQFYVPFRRFRTSRIFKSFAPKTTGSFTEDLQTRFKWTEFFLKSYMRTQLFCSKIRFLFASITCTSLSTAKMNSLISSRSMVNISPACPPRHFQQIFHIQVVAFPSMLDPGPRPCFAHRH